MTCTPLFAIYSQIQSVLAMALTEIATSRDKSGSKEGDYEVTRVLITSFVNIGTADH